MKLVVKLTSGTDINFEAPEGFDFVGFVQSIRETGRWIDASGAYVPHEHIVGIFRTDGTPPVRMPEGVVRQ